MAINLKKLEERTETFTFTYGGQEMEVTYRPANLLKHDYLAGDTTEGRMLSWLQNVVASWDLVGDDGKPLAPSVELIEQVESTFWTALMDATIQDMRAHIDRKKN